MNKPGEPVALILNNATASAGVEVPIYNLGSITARTLRADEYIEIDDVLLVSAPGGDIFVHFGAAADTTPLAASTIARGTVAATGGVGRGSDFRAVGLPGEKVFVVAPTGVVDVHLVGRIRRMGVNAARRSYHESSVPGV